MERVRLEVENVGEFTEAVDLVVLECVKVEANSLQMHNENVGSLRDHLTPLEVDLTIAAITLVVADDLSLDKLCKRLVNRLDSLDWQRKVEVVLHAVFELAALRANHLTAELATKDTLDEMLSGGGFQCVLKAIENQVQKLLSILLLSCIGRRTIKFFECKAELFGVVVVTLRKLEMSDQLLELVHHVVIDLVTPVLLQVLFFAIINTHQVVSEGWHHEELLHH